MFCCSSDLQGHDPFVTKSEESLPSDCIQADKDSTHEHGSEERIAVSLVAQVYD